MLSYTESVDCVVCSKRMYGGFISKKVSVFETAIMLKRATLATLVRLKGFELIKNKKAE